MTGSKDARWRPSGYSEEVPTIQQPRLSGVDVRLRAIVQPGQRSHSVELKPGEPVLIGRDPRCHIVLSEQEVSRRHCRLVLIEGDQLQIEDLGSREGTYINGFCIDRPTPLPLGKKVSIGGYRVRFEKVVLDQPRPSQQMRRCTGCRQRTSIDELRTVKTAVGKELLCAGCRAVVSHVEDDPPQLRAAVRRAGSRDPRPEEGRSTRRKSHGSRASDEARKPLDPRRTRPPGDVRKSRDSRSTRPSEKARKSVDPRSTRPAQDTRLRAKPRDPRSSRPAQDTRPRARSRDPRSPRAEESHDKARQSSAAAAEHALKPRPRGREALDGPGAKRPEQNAGEAAGKRPSPEQASAKPRGSKSQPFDAPERDAPPRTTGKLAVQMPIMPPAATGQPAPVRKPTATLFAQYEVVRKLCDEPYPQVLARSKKTDEAAVLSRFPVRDAGRFLAEVQAVRAIKHAALAKVFGCTAGKGFAYLAQEHIEGETLHALVQRTGPLPEEEVRSIIGQLGEALASLHSWGVFHGNLRPAGIFRTEDGRHLIADFGLEKHRVGSVSAEADMATDIFCLALTLAYLLSGLFLAEQTAPLELRDQPPELILRILVERGEVSDPLMELLAKALAVDPGQNFGSLDAMLRELSKVEFAVVNAAIEQQQGGEFSAPYHLRKIVRQLERDKVTGELRIEGSFGLKTLDGSLWLKKGMLVWAELGPRSGLDTALETLRLKTGEWLFTPFCTPPRDQSFRPRQCSEYIEKK